MQVSMPKTYTQHVHRREEMKITATEATAVQQTFDNECEYCKRRFKTPSALKIHAASCMYTYGTTEEFFEVEEIIDVFGRKENRWFLVRWSGYDEPSWERGHLLTRDGCTDAIRDFWIRSGLSPCAACILS